MRIYFVRHGQSAYNKLALHQTAEVELSEEGIKQAHTVAVRFASIPIDCIYTSDYARARETAKAVAKVTKKPLILTPLLQETKKPTEIASKHWQNEEAVRIKKIILKHKDEQSWHYSDEENWFDIKNRGLKFWEFVKTIREKQVVMVTHEEFLKMILAVMIFGEKLTPGVHHDFFNHLRHKNTGLTVCEENKDRLWILTTWNDHAHLG